MGWDGEAGGAGGRKRWIFDWCKINKKVLIKKAPLYKQTIEKNKRIKHNCQKKDQIFISFRRFTNITPANSRLSRETKACSKIPHSSLKLMS